MRKEDIMDIKDNPFCKMRIVPLKVKNSFDNFNC